MSKFKMSITIFSLVFVGTMSFGSLAMSEEAEMVMDYKVIVEDDIKNRTKYSSTLDLYDAKIDSVRTLKFLKFGEIKNDGESIEYPAQFIDRRSGDAVIANAIIDQSEGKVKKWTIGDVVKGQVQVEVEKEYSNDDIKDFVTTYLEQRTKFTTTYDIYDEKLGSLRNLEIKGIKGDVRQFGKLSVVSVETVDKNSTDTILLDINVAKDKGKLKVSKVRLKENY